MIPRTFRRRAKGIASGAKGRRSSAVKAKNDFGGL